MRVVLSVTFVMCLAAVYSYTDELNVKCPNKDNGNATLIPHPSNCTKYYICTNGVPKEMNCPEGLHFNPVLHICDWPWDANCNVEES